MSLSAAINDVSSAHPFFLVQSSIAQSGLALFRQILTNNINECEAKRTQHLLLFCLCYPRSSLLSNDLLLSPNVDVHDWTHIVPGYEKDWENPSARMMSLVKAGMMLDNFFFISDNMKRSLAPSGPIHVAIDSIDTLLSDMGSVSEAYLFLSRLFGLIKSRPSASSTMPLRPVVNVRQHRPVYLFIL
jgi:elongator complex protein 5